MKRIAVFLAAVLLIGTVCTGCFRAATPNTPEANPSAADETTGESTPDTTTPSPTDDTTAETDAPETDAPETNSPETTSPETDPPETEPEETEVAETDPPASETVPPEDVATPDYEITVGADGCTYIDGVLIVNKTYALPETYAPGRDEDAFIALCHLFNAAKAQGYSLKVASSYRSYADQRYIYNGYVAESGQASADRFSARPGHSEHQTGLAFDLNHPDSNMLLTSFGDSPVGIWIAENCHKYGFIIRYPKNKEHLTGYMYEPWHVRYLGVEKATEVYESGLCLEEFFGITSVYE